MSDEEDTSYTRPATAFYDEPITAHYKHYLLQKKNRGTPMAVDETSESNHLKNLMIQQWEEKQKKELEEDFAEHDAQAANDAKEFISHQQTIATVRKDNVFTSELTEEEQEIVRQRVELQRKQFEQFMKRQNEKRTRKIRTIHPYITEQEALQALKECNEDENEVVERLTQAGFLQEVRKAIATNGKDPDDNSDEDKGNDSDGNGGEIPSDKQFISRKRKNSDKKRLKRLRLDEAIKNADEGKFEGWSEARIRAWQLRDKNPNAYYYRFNDPGVEQRNGTWKKEERELFFKRVEEIGVNGQWGIFSMVIPGRVGYQCSNFYRHLIETGQVVDPNYVIDEKGKAHYLFSKGICKHTKSHKRKDPDEAPQIKIKGQGKKRKRNQKKKKGEEDEDAPEEDDDEYVPPSSLKKQKGEGEEDEEAKKNENPLPGFLDPITLEEVERPAISPSGHVMDYKSWSRCLSSNGGICPLTKQPLKKRDLVILTWKNVHEYTDRIVNWPDKK